MDSSILNGVSTIKSVRRFIYQGPCSLFNEQNFSLRQSILSDNTCCVLLGAFFKILLFLFVKKIIAQIIGYHGIHYSTTEVGNCRWRGSKKSICLFFCPRSDLIARRAKCCGTCGQRWIPQRAAQVHGSVAHVRAFY